MNTLANLAMISPPTMQLPISLSWLRCKVREQHTANWTPWYATCLKPKTYSALHHQRLDAAHTTLPRKLSSAVLGLRTGHGYFLACLAHPPSEKYPSRNCTCPLHPPQTPTHLLLSCPEYHIHRTELCHEPKLHRHSRLNLETILYTPSGTKALLTFISATKIVTAK
jgi:hypothetical protein